MNGNQVAEYYVRAHHVVETGAALLMLNYSLHIWSHVLICTGAN